MKNNRTKFMVSMIFEVISRINQKTYEAKIRRYERMIEMARAAKERRSEILSTASAALGMVESFLSINEEQCAAAKCKSTKKPDTKFNADKSNKNKSRKNKSCKNDK